MNDTHLKFPETVSISVVLPAFNESGRIGNVLEVLQAVPELRQIVIVDDGSTDFTLEEATNHMTKDHRVRVIKHDRNLGKGQALMTGFQATQTPFLLFLDADLSGLRPEHVRALIRPVIRRQADMTLGVFSGGQIHTDFSHWVTPFLTGQRCLRADIFRQVSGEAAAGYGIETAITIAAKLRGDRIKKVVLRGVSHPSSEYHRGFPAGILWRLRMYRQIIDAWSLSGGWNWLFESLIGENVANFRRLFVQAKRWAEAMRGRQ